MDDLKAKLKNITLNPFKNNATAFKGPGRVLGGGEASGSVRPAITADSVTGRLKAAVGASGRLSPEKPTGNNGSALTSKHQHSSLLASAAPSKPNTQLCRSGHASTKPHHHTGQDNSSHTANTLEPLHSNIIESVDAAVALLASQPEGQSAAHILQRLLGNIVSQPEDLKFRRLRLSNPKIHSAVVEVDGGVEMLLSCGFQILFEEPEGEAEQTEGYAVLDIAAPLAPVQHALALLGKLCANLEPARQSPCEKPNNGLGTCKSSSAQGRTHSAAKPYVDRPSANCGDGSGGVGDPLAQQTRQAVLEPPHSAQQQVQRGQQAQQWEPPRPRATRVLLPTSPATDLPSWFFERTGAEVKAAIMGVSKRREQDQVLMTRAMRERLRAPAFSAAPSFALIKVRLPEGIFIQGEFSLREPVAAIYSWVSECLCDPGCTYDLILPPRKVLEVKGQAVRAVPELVPAATLNFRWTGRSCAEMQGVPALRDELLREAQA